MAITPVLVCYLLITLDGYHLNDFLPNFSDEIVYWQQINTFKEVGMNGGYFTFNELAPAAEFTHFYTYGPWYPALYGTIARVIGWNATTTQLINSILVGLALILFCYVARLNERQLLLTILVLATTWSFLLYFFTGMQEGFQQALAIVIASIFVIALRDKDAVTNKFRLVALAFITFATLMRLSWAILYIPFLLLTTRHSSRRLIIAISITLLLIIPVMLFANYTGAPGNNSIFSVLLAFKTSFSAGLGNLTEYFLYNIGRLFLWPKKGTDIVQTYQVLGLIIAFSAYTIQLSIHHRNQNNQLTEAKFHLYNIGVTLVAALALYIVGTGGDQRVLVCHLIISFLIMISFKRYRSILLISFINIIFVTGFIIDFRGLVLPKYEPAHTVYEDFKQLVSTYISYDPNTKNAWCNTMLFSAKYFDSTALIGLPPGIGISFFYDAAKPILTFKSRYLFLDVDDYHIVSTHANAPQLTYLADTAIGKLYRNESVDCSTNSS
ncbi:MAG: hypothetical protein H0X30_27360 [Anaerolineae bacterium]|nr:hypothetical protein [Anaerolineae bacterium]